MNKSYISPTKLSCLALVCLVSSLTMGKIAALLSVIVAASFVFAIAIVSNLEKITSNHVRFVIYALIVSAIMTILKLVFGYIKSLELLDLAAALDYATLACFVLAIMPIYFMHKTTSKSYYLTTAKIALTFVVIGIITGALIELVSVGTVFGLFVYETGKALVGSTFMTFMVLAIACVIGTAIENYFAEKRNAERLLVDKYKYIIRETQIAKLTKQSKEDKFKVFDTRGDK